MFSIKDRDNFKKSRQIRVKKDNNRSKSMNQERIARNNDRGSGRHRSEIGQIRLSLKAVEQLKIKEPDQIVLGLFDSRFGLENYLCCDRMGDNLIHEFTFVLLKSFECSSMTAKLRELSSRISDSNFFKTILYNSINLRNNLDYNINLIRLVLKLSIELLYANENNLEYLCSMKDRLELLVLYRIANEELKTLFENFIKIENEIIEKISRKKNKTFVNIENDDKEPDEDFTTMSIVPNLDDILNNQDIFLRKNITNGSYNNVNHYLDVQFRLLREDFMRPLREGISEFKEVIAKYKKGSELTKEIIKKIKKIQFLNTYFNINCVKMETSQQGIVYVMQADKEKIKSINWEASKRLIYGSLVCFSSDFFLNECLVGIVSERDEKNLREKGSFNVKFDFEIENEIRYPEFGKYYIMLETSAFFESYKHVLKAFKTFQREGEENFPFKENLVYCQNRNMPIPEYLKNACVDFSKLVDKKKIEQYNSKKCFLSNQASWPTAEQMNLDQSQYDAIKLALTSKLSLIQG